MSLINVQIDKLSVISVLRAIVYIIITYISLSDVHNTRFSVTSVHNVNISFITTSLDIAKTVIITVASCTNANLSENSPEN